VGAIRWRPAMSPHPGAHLHRSLFQSPLSMQMAPTGTPGRRRHRWRACGPLKIHPKAMLLWRWPTRRSRCIGTPTLLDTTSPTQRPSLGRPPPPLNISPPSEASPSWFLKSWRARISFLYISDGYNVSISIGLKPSNTIRRRISKIADQSISPDGRKRMWPRPSDYSTASHHSPSPTFVSHPSLSTCPGDKLRLA